MIDGISFHRFKRFADQNFVLHPQGITLIAGGNNSGKSSILHGLAVWQFCKMLLEMERGTDILFANTKHQGLGLGDDEFSPINVPSLKHLWTNLKSQKDTEPDGYTLKIGCSWALNGARKTLEFGLALSNDRLFIKATNSNLAEGDRIPQIAYLPPFAGITDRESRLPNAIRRRRIGEGLAGAIIRNILLDMSDFNADERKRLRGERTKIRDRDLARLRKTDAWELLQQTLRTSFSAELQIEPFNENYHSYIRVNVLKGEVSGYKLKRYRQYNKRDLMVEGSGFLQWLSVYALALDPSVDILLLDEPDAHLHCSLQEHLLGQLSALVAESDKQVLIATHSTEILRQVAVGDIMEIKDSKGRYLRNDQQRVGLLAGLGSEYAPKLNRLQRTRRLLFVEGASDVSLLRKLCERLGWDWPEEWVPWITTRGHKERKHLFLAFEEEIDGLVAVSLRDRDDEHIQTVAADLVDKSHQLHDNFHCRKWRRREIESYLIWPPAIARAAGCTESEVDRQLADTYGIAIPRDKFVVSNAPQALLDLGGKSMLKSGGGPIRGQFDATAHDVALQLEPEAICEDIRTFLRELIDLT